MSKAVILNLKNEEIVDVLTYVNTHRQLVMGNLYDSPGVTMQMKKEAKKLMFSYFRSKKINFGEAKGGKIPSDTQAEKHFKQFLSNCKKRVRNVFEKLNRSH